MSFAPRIVLLGLIHCPWMWGIFFFFFGGIQQSSFEGGSAVSFNFGVLPGEDERLSFYSIIFMSCQIRKGVRQGCISSPVYLTYMQSTSCKVLGWMKHKLE